MPEALPYVIVGAAAVACLVVARWAWNARKHQGVQEQQLRDATGRFKAKKRYKSTYTKRRGSLADRLPRTKDNGN